MLFFDIVSTLHTVQHKVIGYQLSSRMKYTAYKSLQALGDEACQSLEVYRVGSGIGDPGQQFGVQGQTKSAADKRTSTPVT